MAKIDKEKMEKAFQAFMKNPAYKKIYDNAPSEECKKYYRYEYYYSKYYDPEAEDADEFVEMIKEPEKDLSVEDWEYIKSKAGHNPFRAYCDQKIKELTK